MIRDRGARARVRAYLLAHGPVRDESGLATSVLKEAVEYRGSQVGFTQLVAAMDRDGEITREIRGKRTFVIASTETLSAGDSAGSQPVRAGGASGTIRLDYDELARALLREISRMVLADSTAVKAATGFDDGRPDVLDAERADYAAKLLGARGQARAILADYLADADLGVPHGASEADQEQAS